MKNNRFFTQREHMILLTMGLLLLIGYSAIKTLQAKTQSPLAAILHRAYTPCEQALIRTDEIISHLSPGSAPGLTNFATVDVLQPYVRAGELPRCPNGGVIRIGFGNLATVCSVHGPVMQTLPPSPPPRKRSLFEVIGLSRSSHCVGSCIANLKQIDGAVQQWALENKMTDASPVDIFAAQQYLKGGTLPNCPAGGRYYFNVVSNPPYCTISGHSLP